MLYYRTDKCKKDLFGVPELPRSRRQFLRRLDADRLQKGEDLKYFSFPDELHSAKTCVAL